MTQVGGLGAVTPPNLQNTYIATSIYVFCAICARKEFIMIYKLDEDYCLKDTDDIRFYLFAFDAYIHSILTKVGTDKKLISTELKILEMLEEYSYIIDFDGIE